MYTSQHITKILVLAIYIYIYMYIHITHEFWLISA